MRLARRSAAASLSRAWSRGGRVRNVVQRGLHHRVRPVGDQRAQRGRFAHREVGQVGAVAAQRGQHRVHRRPRGHARLRPALFGEALDQAFGGAGFVRRGPVGRQLEGWVVIHREAGGDAAGRSSGVSPGGYRREGGGFGGPNPSWWAQACAHHFWARSWVKSWLARPRRPRRGTRDRARSPLCGTHDRVHPPPCGARDRVHPRPCRPRPSRPLSRRQVSAGEDHPLRRLTNAALTLLHWLAHLTHGALVLAVVLLAGAAWRLAQGPVDVSWLTTRLEAGVNTPDSPIHVDIGHTALAWEGFRFGADSPIDLRLTDVRVTDDRRHQHLTVPQVKLSLSLTALLFGRLQPRLIELDNPRLTFSRAADGSISLRPGGGPTEPSGHDGGDPLPPLLAELARPPASDSGALRGWLSQIRHIRIHDAAVDRAGLAARRHLAGTAGRHRPEAPARRRRDGIRRPVAGAGQPARAAARHRVAVGRRPADHAERAAHRGPAGGARAGNAHTGAAGGAERAAERGSGADAGTATEAAPCEGDAAHRVRHRPDRAIGRAHHGGGADHRRHAARGADRTRPGRCCSRVRTAR